MTETLNARLREVEELLRGIARDARAPEPATHSHWELPVLPPPDAEGQLSSTDLLNWWFRSPQARHDAVAEPLREETPRLPVAKRDEGGDEGDPVADRWTELSILFPEPEEHLADEHAQGAVDCFYDFLHAIGQRDAGAAMALIDDEYHTIDDGVEIDKATFANALAAQLDRLRNSDFQVSLAVAPEPINHELGVLLHAMVQFDAESRADGTKSGHVEERVAILRQDEQGVWKIAGLPRVTR